MNIKLLFSLFFIALTTSLCAQQESKTLVSINAYGYDSAGKEIEDHFYTVANGIEEGPDKTYTMYNTNGTKKEIVSVNLLNDTTEKIDYLYATKSITRTTQVYSGSISQPQSKIVYYGVNETNEIDEWVVVFLLDIPMYKCDSFKIYTWEQGVWTVSAIGKYTYNNGNPTKLILSLNDFVEDMAIDVQVVYQYDNNNNCTKMFASVLYLSMPLSIMNVEQTFDASFKLTETYMYPNVNPLLTSYFGTDVTEFLTAQKIRYTYNINDDIETITQLDINEDTEEFEKTSERDYVYKSQNISGNQRYLVDTIYGYVYGNQVSIRDIVETAIKIYPNPSSEVITIEGVDVNSVLSIYDISGRRMFGRILRQDGESIQIQTLTPGMYLLKIQTKEGVYISKFVKE